jgi:hypothetical protein
MVPPPRELTPVSYINLAFVQFQEKRDRTGGLGLQLLMEFIRQNNGRLIIVSGAAYWQIARREISGCLLQVPFPGTSVTIEVDTADRSSYCLKSEINPASIF